MPLVTNPGWKRKAREKTTEPALKKKVEAAGGLCVKMHAAYFVGVPDRLCLLPGARVVFVETKSQGVKPKPHQKAVHDILKRLGFPVWVVSTRDELTKFSSEWL